MDFADQFWALLDSLSSRFTVKGSTSTDIQLVDVRRKAAGSHQAAEEGQERLCASQQISEHSVRLQHPSAGSSPIRNS